MRWITFTILLLAFGILDAGNILNYIAFGPMNVRPDMMVILALFLAINCDKGTATLLAFAAGFVADSASTTMGPHLVMFGLTGYLGSLLQRDLIMRTVTAQAFTILALGALACAGVVLLTALKPGFDVQFSWTEIGGTVLYSAIIGPAAWALLKGLSPLMGIERLRHRT